MSGQADTAPESLDDLASFLVDNPEADQSGDSPRSNEPDDEPDNSNADPDTDPDEDPDQPEDDPEDPDAPEEEPAKGRQGLKFKVPVKGEDGADTTIEVDEKELVAGYQRHADYTRKTQELSNREREAYEVVSKKLDEGRNYFVQQAQLAHAAIQHLAGLKTEQEMAQLAATDQAAWVQERARHDAITGVLSHLKQAVQTEQQQAEQEQQQQARVQIQQAWGVLSKEGITEPKLLEIFKGVNRAYGVDPSRLKRVSDPALVFMMRDAMAYREIQGKAKAVKEKVQNAPRLPAPRQNVPKSEQVNKQVQQRFKTGRARVNDLAAFIHSKNI
jgi:hypothetical protein